MKNALGRPQITSREIRCIVSMLTQQCIAEILCAGRSK